MNIVLGIDAGGSRTRAWLVGHDGAVVARGAAGPANVHRLGVDAARRAIADAAAGAWTAAGLPGERARGFTGVFAGVAGAGSFELQRALATALAAEFGAAPHTCIVDHDLRVALAGALAGEPGVVLVAGTGSACFGRTADGTSGKAGGWGPQLDDGGSGVWLGWEAMRAVVRAADGRLASTPFVQAVAAALGIGAAQELLALVREPSAGGLEASAIAALAPLVLEAAEADAVAAGILERGARELAAMAAAVLRRLEAGMARQLRLAGAGGLLENHERYRSAVEVALRCDFPGAKVERAQLPPVAGAALLALEIAGVPRDAGVLGALRAAVQPPGAIA